MLSSSCLYEILIYPDYNPGLCLARNLIPINFMDNYNNFTTLVLSSRNVRILGMMNTRLSTITINVQLITQLAYSMSPLAINTPQFIVQSLH